MNGISLPLISMLIVIAAVAFLAGVALGYALASREVRKVRASAWARGRADAIRASRDPDSSASIAAVANPYLDKRRALAGEPPVYREVVPIPASTVHPLFDQDAIEIRGDE